MVFFRADMNSTVASGHIMRCLSIACVLRNLGEKCVFISADELPSEIIKQNGFECKVLSSQWDFLDNEIDAVCEIIKKESFPLLIIDSYYVSYRYLSELSKFAYTVLIDDLNMFSYPVSCVVNYNIYSEKYFNYENSEKTEFVLGPHYVPLREQFYDATSIKINKTVKNVFISTGMSDLYAIKDGILRAVSEIDKFQSINFHVLSGAFHLKNTFNKNNIFLYSDVSNMYALLKKNDIAISAAGSTLYELCACGIPTICFSFTDNQIPGAQCFNEKGIMINIGDYRNCHKPFFDLLISEFSMLCDDYDKRMQMSDKAFYAVNSNGAKSLTEILLKKYSIAKENFFDKR